MYSKTLAKAYAVAVLREDLGLTFAEVAERMDCSPSNARYLYDTLIQQERKGKQTLNLWNKKSRQ